jgi:tRNA threonylcarbamoyladenosine biosynthesis protein TsaE
LTGFNFVSNSLDDTDRLGSAFAAAVQPPTVVALMGTLGAGKTRFVEAVAAACGANREDVVSPTFVLCHHYDTRPPIHHLDAYRLRDDDEFLELGPDELFESPSITLIEWADRVAACLPRDHLRVEISLSAADQRHFAFTAIGKNDAVLARLAERLA